MYIGCSFVILSIILRAILGLFSNARLVGNAILTLLTLHNCITHILHRLYLLARSIQWRGLIETASLPLWFSFTVIICDTGKGDKLKLIIDYGNLKVQQCSLGIDIRDLIADGAGGSGRV